MSFAISSCTREKEVRALWREVPHTVLHILFMFFFGGSDFIWFSIFLSAIKVVWIPMLREFVIIKHLKSWRCSRDAAKMLMINEGWEEERIRQAVYELAKEEHRNSIIAEF